MFRLEQRRRPHRFYRRQGTSPYKAGLPAASGLLKPAFA